MSDELARLERTRYLIATKRPAGGGGGGSAEGTETVYTWGEAAVEEFSRADVDRWFDSELAVADERMRHGGAGRGDDEDVLE